MKDVFVRLWADLVKPAIVEAAVFLAGKLIQWVVDRILEAAANWLARLLGWAQGLIARGADERDVRIAGVDGVLDLLAGVAAKAEFLRGSGDVDRLVALFTESEPELALA